MNREEVREMTMQLVFQMDATGEFDYEKLSIVEEDTKVIGKRQALDVLKAVRDHHDEIDAVITSNLEKWTIDRVSKSDLAVLRTATAEMMYCPRIPRRVSINEAVNMSRKYGDSKSYAFVNSVLSKIDKQLEDVEISSED